MEVRTVSQAITSHLHGLADITERYGTKSPLHQLTSQIVSLAGDSEIRYMSGETNFDSSDGNLVTLSFDLWTFTDDLVIVSARTSESEVNSLAFSRRSLTCVQIDQAPIVTYPQLGSQWAALHLRLIYENRKEVALPLKDPDEHAADQDLQAFLPSLMSDLRP
jgi:hypothetical protein